MRIPVIERFKDTEELNITVPKITNSRPILIFRNDKEIVKYVKYIERLVRSSYEYKEYIKYLIETCEMDVCSIYQNLNKSIIPKLRLEIHHEPFTLFDIVAIILKRAINLDKPVNEYDLVEDVMDIHFRGMVGLIPLSLTAHQLVHVGKLFIPIQCIDPGFLKFYEEYKDEISQCELLTVLEKKIELSKKYDFKSSNMILQHKYIYIDPQGYDNMADYLE